MYEDQVSARQSDDALWTWRERMLDLFDGYARQAARAMV